MPFQPSLPERTFLLTLNQGPGALLDLFNAAAFRLLMAALDLGLFEALAAGPLPVERIAARLDADPRALGELLPVLESWGFVRRRAGGYENRPIVTKWLLAEAPDRTADFLRWWQEIVFPFWDAHLEASLRRGRAPLTIYEWLDAHPGRWPVAQAGFEATARLALDEVLDRLRASPTTGTLLDLGGGHGLYTVELCRRLPALHATILDRPAALERAAANVAEADLEERVTLVGGDYLTTEAGAGFDLVLLFNVLHAHEGDGVTTLLRRAAAALRPGGRVAILEQFEGGPPLPLARASARLLSFTYLSVLGGRIHPYAEIEKRLRDAGFTQVERQSLRRVPGNALVSAIRGTGRP